MNRKMERLANQVENLLGCAVFLKISPKTDNNSGYHYFLVFRNTWKVIGRWHTQAEAVEGLREILDRGYVTDGHMVYGNFVI